MPSVSAAASASVSIRNQVFPPGASQTYLMHPPNFPMASRYREPSGRCSIIGGGRNAGKAGSATRSDHYSSIFRRVADLLRFVRRTTGGTGRFRPISPQRYQGGHDCRAEKQPDNTEGFQAAENPQQHPQERQTCGAADDGRPNRMIGDKDDDETKTEDRRAGDRTSR